MSSGIDFYEIIINPRKVPFYPCFLYGIFAEGLLISLLNFNRIIKINYYEKDQKVGDDWKITHSHWSLIK